MTTTDGPDDLLSSGFVLSLSACSKFLDSDFKFSFLFQCSSTPDDIQKSDFFFSVIQHLMIRKVIETLEERAKWELDQNGSKHKCLASVLGIPCNETVTSWRKPWDQTRRYKGSLIEMKQWA